MTAARPLFLLLGFASEYSLGAIAQLLRNAGEQVIEIDFSVAEMPDLGDTEVVLITSQHPARSAWIFRHVYGQVSPYDRYLSPMECVRQLNVRCSVLIPHDLEHPIMADEIGYLSFFDFYCSPYEFNPGLSRVCQPLYTGWVKNTDIDAGEFAHQAVASQNGVFFVNRLVELIRCGGALHLLGEYATAVDHEVPFKLPCWPSVVDIEKKLEQAGAKVIPADTSSTLVITHCAQVFSNAKGSVLAEAAYFGVPAHIVAPRTIAFPAPLPRGRQRKPFDFQLLMKAIQSHLDETSKL